MSLSNLFKLKSFAKINLGLEIVSRRADGYHNLKTIFQTIDLFDRITVKTFAGEGLFLSGNHPDINWGLENTIFRIYQSCRKLLQPGIGFEVYVEKNIPPGAGLGGGSSNAAVFLLFLTNFFTHHLELSELIEIGL